MQEAWVVLTNMPDMDSAAKLARHLVDQGLAGCVNILPGVQSVYRWQGKVEQQSEATLLIKIVAARYPAVQAEIQALHPYELPEIIALPVAQGLPAYLDWIAEGS
jgi:periplasmic divalent cation tolerance protein